MNNNKNISYKDLYKIIEKKENIILSTHVNPDGDGLGSELGFYYHIISKGINCRIINLSKTPEKYKFMDKNSIIEIYNNDLDKSILKSDLVIAFDIGDYKRLMGLGKTVKNKIPVICFDHHPLLHEELYSKVIVDIKSPATGYMVWKYLINNNVYDFLPLKIAIPLYVSLITDTGSFKYECTSADTHRMAAHLIESGVDSYSLQREIYEQNKFSHIKLTSTVINNLKFRNNDRIVWGFINKSILDKCKANDEDIDGINDYIRSIKGVEVAFLLYQNENKIKINFRSKGKITVNDIAAKLNGGGHRYAAGALITGMDIKNVEKIILTEINNKLENLDKCQ